MLAIAFVLASRLRWLEDVFGGLDKVDQVHHRLGRAAFVLLIVHPVAHALRFVPERLDKALLFLLPTHRDLAVDLGVYAFWGLLLLMVPTLFVTVAYDRWKLSHKFLGAVLIVAAIHMLTVQDTPGRTVAVTGNPILMYYMIALTTLGVLSFIHKAAVLPFLSRRTVYVVENVERLNDQVLRIELSPRKRRIDFAPGQFVFVTFDQQGLSREAHPFTICSVPDTGRIVLTVKALGDFTQALHRRLRPGAKAWVEGPYGRFDYRSASAEQIWLAAGVGIAPFLSWARHLAYLRDKSRRARLYYCVRIRGEAVHYEEFQRIAERQTNLDVTLVCSQEQGRVRAADLGDVRDKDILMCGPRRFTSDLKAQLLRLGVPNERIHFEDFEFR
jgi:predicted ferric reductase